MKAVSKNRASKAAQPVQPAEEGPHLIGYARVSTRDQDPQLQINALLAAGVDERDIYYETASGASKRRPQFDAMMKDAREGDIVIVWKLDRLGRTVRGVLDTIDRLDAKGAKIKCLTQPIDTTSALGRLVIAILAAVGEMERELGRERTMAGLARAKAEGRGGGATARHTDRQILEFTKLGMRPGAKAAGMSNSGFQKAVKRARERLKEKRNAKR